jgi:ADP-heptose:LPS heptosyltransferase
MRRHVRYHVANRFYLIHSTERRPERICTSMDDFEQAGRISNAGVRRIAVLRALQLGDMLCAVPAFRLLRDAYPSATITLIGLPWARDFVRRFSQYVDDFMEFPGWPSLPEREPDASAIPCFLAAVRDREFDLAVQMHGDGRLTNTIVAMFGAPLVAGACADDAWRPPGGHFGTYPEDASEGRRALASLLPLGLETAREDLEFPLCDADREGLRSHFTPDEDGAGIVVVHPGARSMLRRWPAVYFAKVADELAAAGNRVVITGSKDERALALEVAASMRRRPVVLAGRTDLGALAALIASSRLVVCNDTGVSHLADALRIPSVVMFTGSDPQRWAPLDGRLHRCLTHPDTLDPQRVLAHAHDLLSHEAVYAL